MLIRPSPKSKSKVKSWPNWIPISGAQFTSTDFYGRVTPGVPDLIKHFDDLVFAATSLIANTVACTPIRLYVKTELGQARPKCAVRPVGHKTLCDLRQT